MTAPHPHWCEFGAEMRRLREAFGVSLRRAENLSGYTRGMLSQAETGRARPSRTLVRWYDGRFEGAGMLLAAYEAMREADMSATDGLGDPTSR